MFVALTTNKSSFQIPAKRFASRVTDPVTDWFKSSDKGEDAVSSTDAWGVRGIHETLFSGLSVSPLSQPGTYSKIIHTLL